MSILVDNFEFKDEILRRMSLVAPPVLGGPSVPVDLTGCSAVMRLKSKVTTAGYAAVELTSAGAGIVLGGTPYNILIDLAHTSSLPVGKYDYDFVLTNSLGKVRNRWTGTATKLASV